MPDSRSSRQWLRRVLRPETSHQRFWGIRCLHLQDGRVNRAGIKLTEIWEGRSRTGVRISHRSLLFYHEDGGYRLLRNVSKYLMFVCGISSFQFWWLSSRSFVNWCNCKCAKSTNKNPTDFSGKTEQKVVKDDNNSINLLERLPTAVSC